jgi:hypothetical protein
MAGTFGVVDPVEWVIGGEAESPKPPIAGRRSFEHGRVHGSPDQLGRGGEHKRINVERAGAPAPPSDSGEPQLRQGRHREGGEQNSPEFSFFLGKVEGRENEGGKTAEQFDEEKLLCDGIQPDRAWSPVHLCKPPSVPR